MDLIEWMVRKFHKVEPEFLKFMDILLTFCEIRRIFVTKRSRYGTFLKYNIEKVKINIIYRFMD